MVIRAKGPVKLLLNSRKLKAALAGVADVRPTLFNVFCADI